MTGWIIAGVVLLALVALAIWLATRASAQTALPGGPAATGGAGA